MRKLTFKSYLISECRKFSDYDGSSLYVFARLCESNARLKDALCLYLVLYTQEKLRNRLLKKYGYLKSSCTKLMGLNEENMEAFLQEKNLTQFSTIYNNFLYVQNHKLHEDKIKTMMYNKILYLQNKKQITNYRVYKELNLNPGNINAFLKNGDMGKVSLDTARKILSFVNEYPAL